MSEKLAKEQLEKYILNLQPIMEEAKAKEFEDYRRNKGTLLAQNPSFDIGAGHRGVSRNAKIHNLTRNNPNLKEVEAAKQMLGGVRLPTF